MLHSPAIERVETVLGILLELIERIVNDEEGKDVKGDMNLTNYVIPTN